MPDRAEIIARLKLLPVLFELDNQTQVAAKIGLSYKTWHHTIRTGDMSFPTADAIVFALPGMTSDWLRYGSEGGLTAQLLRKVREARRQAS